MKPINFEWISAWADKSNIEVSNGTLLSLSYREISQTRIVIKTDCERTPVDLVLLANRLARIDCEEAESRSPSVQEQSHIFWIRESGIWNDVSEAIAAESFAALLKGYGQVGRTEGLLFGNEESRTAALFILLTILFGWDVYFVPLSGLFLCRVSHDGYIEFRARRDSILQNLLSRVSAWGAEITIG